MRAALPLLTLVTLFSLSLACGRSPETVCRVTETGSSEAACQNLFNAQLAEESLFTAAVDAQLGDEASDRGRCTETIERERVERQCFANRLALCDEACRLHPCATLNADGVIDSTVACNERCVQESEANAIGDDALSATVVRAAQNPGFCTCAVCDEASAALCTNVWGC